MIVYQPEKEDFGMKNMNRVEIYEFTQKYFKSYGKDIKKVSYIVYEDRTEYLINNHYLFLV